MTYGAQAKEAYANVKASMQRVVDINLGRRAGRRLQAGGKMQWYAALNKLSDWDPAKYNKTVLMTTLLGSTRSKFYLQDKLKMRAVHNPNNKRGQKIWGDRTGGRRLQQDLPPTVDWVAAGKVSPVRDQLDCGGCWALSATAVAETKALIVSGKTYSEAGISLAPQQLLDCVTPGNGYESNGCQGGYPDEVRERVEAVGAVAVVVGPSWVEGLLSPAPPLPRPTPPIFAPTAQGIANLMYGGQVAEKSYAYKSGTSRVTGACQTDLLATAKDKVTAVEGPDYIEASSATALMAALVKGPVAFLMKINTDYINYGQLARAFGGALYQD